MYNLKKYLSCCIKKISRFLNMPIVIFILGIWFIRHEVDSINNNINKNLNVNLNRNTINLIKNEVIKDLKKVIHEHYKSVEIEKFTASNLNKNALVQVSPDNKTVFVAYFLNKVPENKSVEILYSDGNSRSIPPDRILNNVVILSYSDIHYNPFNRFKNIRIKYTPDYFSQNRIYSLEKDVFIYKRQKDGAYIPGILPNGNTELKNKGKQQ